MTKEYLQKSIKIHKNEKCYVKAYAQDTFGIAFSSAKNSEYKKQYQDIYELLLKLAVPLGKTEIFYKNHYAIHLKEGECIITSAMLTEKTGASRKVWEKLRKGLKQAGIIDYKSTPFYTIVTFLNFKERQKPYAKVKFDKENHNYKLNEIINNTNKSTSVSQPIIKEIKNSSKEELVTEKTDFICQEEKDIVDSYKSLHQSEELKDIDIKDHKIISKEFKEGEKPEIIEQLKEMEAPQKLKSKDIFNAFKKSKLFNFKGKYLTFSLFLKKLKEWFIEFIAQEHKEKEKQNLKERIEAEEKIDLSNYPQTKELNKTFHNKLERFIGSEVFNAFFKNTFISKQENQLIELAFPSKRCYDSYFLHYKDKVERVLYDLKLKIKNIIY